MNEATRNGTHLAELRERAGLGLRELARNAGISATALSAIEKGKTSPTLATLHKLLKALGTDFVQFFADADEHVQSPVFTKKDQRSIRDAHRQYTLLLPRRSDLKFEMVFETLLGTEKTSEWEVHDCDVGGCVLAGGPLRLEIENVGTWTLRCGDSFYIKKDLRHRGVNLGVKPVKLITVFDPPRY